MERAAELAEGMGQEIPNPIYSRTDVVNVAPSRSPAHVNNAG